MQCSERRASAASLTSIIKPTAISFTAHDRSNASLSLSFLSTSALILSPSLNLPARISSERASRTFFWMTRFSGCK